MTTVPTLQVVREAKIQSLLPEWAQNERWEASGVLARDGKFFVVFDNLTSVARIAEDLVPTPMNGLFGTGHTDEGYEGIARNDANGRYYLLVESRQDDRGRFHSVIVEYDDTLAYVKNRPMDFFFKSGNKGFEAVAHVRRDGQDYALGLCEGNKCKSGKAGRKPGAGRVQLFEKRKKRWAHIGTIKLPESVLFEDYSDMAVDVNRVAVVSQVNSQLWVGVFEKARWNWRDEGQLYNFPRGDDGAILYGNIEGVSWISPTRLVTVSDRRKRDQSELVAEKDQSVHVVDLPQ